MNVRTHRKSTWRRRLIPALSGGLASVFLLAGIAVQPAAAQIFNPTTYTLDNGLQIVVIENHRAPVVTHMLWYKVGAADEPPGKSGIAHMLEHLMFKGTKTREAGAFSDLIARNGGRENAFTSQDYTGYFQNIAADRLPLMMEFEADRMNGLVLTDEIINPERLVVIEERRSRIENRPAQLLREHILAAAYSNHPYRLPIIGWEHEIVALDRDAIVDFYETWYAPNNAVLVVSGDVKPERVRELAETYYGPIPAKKLPERLRPSEPPHHAPREVVMRDARVEQPSWSRRWLAPSYVSGDVEHAHALEVLAQVLGGGSSSRLHSALVIDQALAVGAGAWYQPDSLNTTTFGMGFSPRPGVDVDTLATALEAEVARFLENGATAEEVERAKQRMVDRAVFARDSLGGPARIFGRALTSGQTVEDVEQWPNRISAVTVEQVNAAARAVLRPETSTTGILLPLKEEGKS
ncbi:MAG: insulinase family protein [Alphaproteobacteria bacterium]|nr:insulinase family protein [Alphaproteobacteria bacterium]